MENFILVAHDNYIHYVSRPSACCVCTYVPHASKSEKAKVETKIMFPSATIFILVQETCHHPSAADEAWYWAKRVLCSG